MDRPQPADPAHADLATYQASLLELLHDGHDGPAMSAQIQLLLEGLSAQGHQLDPVLVEVAADLTRTWARIAAPS